MRADPSSHRPWVIWWLALLAVPLTLGWLVGGPSRGAWAVALAIELSVVWIGIRVLDARIKRRYGSGRSDRSA
jgi:hypothetical protein